MRTNNLQVRCTLKMGSSCSLCERVERSIVLLRTLQKNTVSVSCAGVNELVQVNEILVTKSDLQHYHFSFLGPLHFDKGPWVLKGIKMPSKSQNLRKTTLFSVLVLRMPLFYCFAGLLIGGSPLGVCRCS